MTNPSETDEGPVTDKTPDETAISESGDADTAAQATVDTEEIAEADGQSDDGVPEPGPADPPVNQSSRRGGFASLVLGGVIAAALGAGAVYLAGSSGLIRIGSDEALNQALSDQDARIGDLLARLEAQDERLAGLDQKLADADANALAAATGATEGLVETVTDTQARLDILADRLGALEVQPIPAAELPAEVVAAYEARLADMQARLDQQVGELQGRIDAELEEVRAASAAAADVQRQAEDAANLAAARASFSTLEGALAAGGGFAPALEDIRTRTGIEAGAVLSASAADGIPTADALGAAFPGYARAALDASVRAAAADGSVDRFSAFLQTQLGTRSLEPRDGDDPDAVLSRAEAALKAGDLDTALAEIGALPEVGRAEMADWVADATLRRDALTDAATLSAELMNN